ncbi:protein ROOT INITIATION DEFECTIVE 3 isoform X2 [Nymphaea colorata]|nr:protein ROOT INITIATION DEFECTIVE 3 isoform X2 [Nymphaea colorata]XP_031486088.1 protein ROOT INITIATION DEFECTIVE 3 isoform X2 [Nymphaea colorata]
MYSRDLNIATLGANEIIIAASDIDSEMCCWDLLSGAVRFRLRPCASSPHAIACVGGCFFAASQVRKAASSSVFYWPWNKSQAETRSFVEPIKPLSSNDDGTYIIGGGRSGAIYLWEVATGRLLRRWAAHFKEVTCLIFSDDGSLIISGSEDGSVKVWSILRLLDDGGNLQHEHPYEHRFHGHTLPVTDVVSGYGGCNAIIISSSDDCTCKVWSLSLGVLLRTISFPDKVAAVALEPGEYAFYAACNDANIYIGALNCGNSTDSIYGKDIIGMLSDHSEAVTCLALSIDGVTLVSGSKDKTVRVWNTITRQVLRILKHDKGPISNILVMKQPSSLGSSWLPNSRSLPPPLHRHITPEVGHPDDGHETNPLVSLQHQYAKSLDGQLFTSSHLIKNQVKELEKRDSLAKVKSEMGKLKSDHSRSLQALKRWKNVYEDLHSFCINELIDSCKETSNEEITTERTVLEEMNKS